MMYRFLMAKENVRYFFALQKIHLKCLWSMIWLGVTIAFLWGFYGSLRLTIGKRRAIIVLKSIVTTMKEITA